MIFHDTGGNYPIICSFCSAEEDCNHLLVLFNKNKGGIEKGAIKIHWESILAFIHSQLASYVSKTKVITESPFFSDKLNDIWYDIFSVRKDFILEKGFNENEFKSIIENISYEEYIMECIDSTHIGETGISFSDQPGSTDSFEIFHVEDTDIALSQIIKYIREDFEKPFLK
jgi:hypothetical protein